LRRPQKKNSGGKRINRPKTITNKQAGDLSYWLEGRFAVLFDLACESGLRISDILNLKVKDVSKNPMTIHEKKSKRSRTIKISDELFKKLEWQAAAGRPNDYVFNSHHKNGVPLHRSTIHRRIKKAIMTLKFDASAHSARKLYAQNIFSETGSVEAVQKALNHHRTDTTRAYLDLPQHQVHPPQKNATGRAGNAFKRIWQKIKNFLGGKA